MPKLERLITLAKMKQGGKQMTVREMSQACGVSQRTLYRYLNTLTELDPLAELESQSDSTRLSAEEINLLRYALDHNPLAEYPHFARLFRDVGRKLGFRQNSLNSAEVYQFKPVRPSRTIPAVNRWLDRFIKAYVEHCPVKIELQGRRSEIHTMWPCGVLIRGDRVSLLLAKTEQGWPQEFELGRIRKLEICRGHSCRGHSCRGKSSEGARQPHRKKG